MGFEDRIKEFDEYSKDFKVEKYGVNIWPYLRFYALDKIHFSTDRKPSITYGILKQQLKALFFGFRNWFRKVDLLVFSNASYRRDVNGTWLVPADYLATHFKNPLIIEFANKPHKRKSQLPDHPIVGKSILLSLERLLTFFIRVPREVSDIEEMVNNEFGIKANFAPIYKQFVARYVVTRFLVRRYKPKIAEVTVAYVDMPRVLALKKKGIPVIEFQHGVINRQHHGYQLFNKIDDKLLPDYLLSFGEKEVLFAQNSEYVDFRKVIPVGSFYLDYISNTEVSPVYLDSARKKYSLILAATGQNSYDHVFIPFLKKVMERKDDWMCLFIPRTGEEKEYRDKYGLGDQFLFIDELNTYEKIKISDIHTTVNSTCALESLRLGTANVLYNYENKASGYYEPVVSDSRYFTWSNDVDGFISEVESRKQLSKEEIENNSNDLFAIGFEKRLGDFVESLKKEIPAL